MQTLCWTSVIWIEFSDYSNDGQATLEIIDVFKEAIHKKTKTKTKKKQKQNKNKINNNNNNNNKYRLW